MCRSSEVSGASEVRNASYLISPYKGHRRLRLRLGSPLLVSGVDREMGDSEGSTRKNVCQAKNLMRCRVGGFTDAFTPTPLPHILPICILAHNV